MALLVQRHYFLVAVPLEPMTSTRSRCPRCSICGRSELPSPWVALKKNVIGLHVVETPFEADAFGNYSRSLRLLETFTYPSVVGQSESNFLWLLRVDEARAPRRVLDALRGLAKDRDDLLIVDSKECPGDLSSARRLKERSTRDVFVRMEKDDEGDLKEKIEDQEVFYLLTELKVGQALHVCALAHLRSAVVKEMKTKKKMMLGWLASRVWLPNEASLFGDLALNETDDDEPRDLARTTLRSSLRDISRDPRLLKFLEKTFDGSGSLLLGNTSLVKDDNLKKIVLRKFFPLHYRESTRTTDKIEITMATLEELKRNYNVLTRDIRRANDWRLPVLLHQPLMLVDDAPDNEVRDVVAQDNDSLRDVVDDDVKVEPNHHHIVEELVEAEPPPLKPPQEEIPSATKAIDDDDDDLDDDDDDDDDGDDDDDDEKARKRRKKKKAKKKARKKKRKEARKKKKKLTQKLATQDVDVTLVVEASCDLFWSIEIICKRWTGSMVVVSFEACEPLGRDCDNDDDPFAKKKRNNLPRVRVLNGTGLGAVTTSHFLKIDADVWPDAGLYEKLRSVADDVSKVEGVVVPCVEVSHLAAAVSDADGYRSCRHAKHCVPTYEKIAPKNFKQLLACFETGNCHAFDHHSSTDYTQWITQKHTLTPLDCLASPDYEPYLMIQTELPDMLRTQSFKVLKQSFLTHLPHRKEKDLLVSEDKKQKGLIGLEQCADKRALLRANQPCHLSRTARDFQLASPEFRSSDAWRRQRYGYLHRRDYYSCPEEEGN